MTSLKRYNEITTTKRITTGITKTIGLTTAMIIFIHWSDKTSSK